MEFVRHLLDVVEQELKSVVPSAGRGRLGPSVVDCPRSHSSGWRKRLSCSLERLVAFHRRSQGKSYVGRGCCVVGR